MGSNLATEGKKRMRKGAEGEGWGGRTTFFLEQPTRKGPERDTGIRRNARDSGGERSGKVEGGSTEGL